MMSIFKSVFGEKAKANHKIYYLDYLRPLYMAGMQFHSNSVEKVYLTDEQYDALMEGSKSIEKLGVQLAACDVRIVDMFVPKPSEKIQVNTAFCLCPSCQSNNKPLF